MAARLTQGGRKSYYKKKFFFTIRERILLHLSEFGIYENEVEAPDDLTQFGIADVVLAGRSTCSKILQEMEEQGLLYGRRAHVPSGKIRRTVYFLTPRGHMEAQKIRAKVDDTVVKIKRPSGELQRLRVPDIPPEVPIHARLVDVVCHISRGTFDVERFVRQMESRRGRVAYVGSMPRFRHFFGRAEELEGLKDWFNAPGRKVQVVYGLPGVGKTTLAGKLVSDLRNETNLFWYRFHPWSTVRDVVREIGAFLSRLGEKDLFMYAETRERLDMPEVLLLLDKNLEGQDAILVFDDYDRSEGELDPFFSELKDILERVDGPKLLVISRKKPKFYNPKDVKVSKLIVELRLGGLDREGAATLLTLKNIPSERFARIYRQTKGHPLFLELLQGIDHTDVRDVDAFLADQVEGRLLDVEKRVLGLASVFRRPVPSDGLLMEKDADFVVLTSLVDQSLLVETLPKTYDLHDLVRAFFYGRLRPSERKKYHRAAAQFYASGGEPGDLVESQYHFLQAGSVSDAARSAIRNGRALIDRGYLEEFARLLDALQDASLNPQQGIQIRLLQGRIHDVRGDWDEAASLYFKVIRDARMKNLRRVEAEALRLLGQLQLSRGEHGKAEKTLRRAATLYGKLKDKNGQATVHYQLGFIRDRTGEFMEAYRSFRRGMRLVQQDGDPAIQARILYAFGVNYGHRGNYKKSVSYKLRAMNILEDVRDLRWLAKVYTGLGASYAELEDDDQAEFYYEKGIDFARLVGDQRTLGYALQDLASARLYQRRYDDAEDLIGEASAIFRRIGEERKIAWSLLYEGGINFARGRTQNAADAWKRGLDRLRATRDARGEALFSLAIARLYAERGDFVPAKEHLKEAQRAARKLDNEPVLQKIQEEQAKVEDMLSGKAVPGKEPIPGPASS